MNWRLYFLKHLTQMSLGGKMSIVGEHHFGMVMRTDFLMKFFFFHGGSLGKVTGSKIEVVVVETVVGVVERVV